MNAFFWCFQYRCHATTRYRIALTSTSQWVVRIWKQVGCWGVARLFWFSTCKKIMGKMVKNTRNSAEKCSLSRLRIGWAVPIRLGKFNSEDLHIIPGNTNFITRGRLILQSCLQSPHRVWTPRNFCEHFISLFNPKWGSMVTFVWMILGDGIWSPRISIDPRLWHLYYLVSCRNPRC